VTLPYLGVSALFVYDLLFTVLISFQHKQVACVQFIVIIYHR